MRRFRCLPSDELLHNDLPVMTHLFINALAASAGGGLTYIRNVVPHLARRERLKATVLLDARLARELQASANIAFLERNIPSSVAVRFYDEQRAVPRLIRQCGADVLLCTGNFASLNSPVPQILLSRNALYTSRDFYSDLRSRGDYRLWLDTEVKGAFAKWSIQRADTVVAPSEAFAKELRSWTGKPIAAIHHGFDRAEFVRDPSPLPEDILEKLDSARDALRLLFVSHYNYYRNFETLIRAMPRIQQLLGSRKVVLFLTCKLADGANPGAYRASTAAALVRELRLSSSVVELGAVPYGLLHHLYRAANIYVSPAYAESFAHPLVEAMSSALSVVASDLPVHREICGAAALYFERFSAQELAEGVAEVALSADLAKRLSEAGLARSTAFSWKNHVDSVVTLAESLISR
jgi:glycosyltransferase involved in cell wall biosynthesis